MNGEIERAPDLAGWDSAAGGRVRRARLALDLTQKAVAGRVGCSVDTVKKIEQGRRRPSRSMATRLSHVLGLPLGPAAGAEATAARPRTGDPARPPTGVAQWTSFVGRTRELSQLDEWMGDERLITVCGPGGAGKSRLAAEVLARSSGRVTGTWVQLAGPRRDQAAATLLAEALQVRCEPPQDEVTTVLQLLSTGVHLIVLDNCEQLIGEVTSLAAGILETCPGTTLVLTSRVATRLAGERLLRLSGLPLSTASSTDEVRRSDAVRLFVDRTRTVDPSFTVGVDNLDAVVRVCRSVDCLPLGVELAASRGDVFDVTGLAERIEHDLGVLHDEGHVGRSDHRSLAGVVEWSLGLLDQDAQELLLALSVFEDSFDLSAARRVRAATSAARLSEDQLARLLASSLVAWQDHPALGRRYRLLETVRHVVSERRDRDQRLTELLRSRHRSWCVEAVETAAAGLWSENAGAGLDQIAAIQHDVEVVLEWAWQCRADETLARLVASLGRFWDLRGRLRDGLRWTLRAEDASTRCAPRVEAAAANALGTMQFLCGEIETATATFARARDRAEAVDDRGAWAYALQYLGMCASWMDDVATARAHLTRSLEVAATLDDPTLTGWSSVFLASAELRVGRLDEGAALLRSASADLQKVGELEGLGWACVGLAVVSHYRGHPDPALSQVRRSLECFSQLRAAWGTSVVGIAAGLLAAARGDDKTARRLLDLSDELATAANVQHLPLMSMWRSDLADALGAPPSHSPPSVRPSPPESLRATLAMAVHHAFE